MRRLTLVIILAAVVFAVLACTIRIEHPHRRDRITSLEQAEVGIIYNYAGATTYVHHTEPCTPPTGGPCPPPPGRIPCVRPL